MFQKVRFGYKFGEDEGCSTVSLLGPSQFQVNDTGFLKYLMAWNLISICLVLNVHFSDRVIFMQSWLSSYIVFCNFCGKITFSNNLINHIVFGAALTNTIYYASAKECATHHCFFVIPWMGSWPNRNIGWFPVCFITCPVCVCVIFKQGLFSVFIIRFTFLNPPRWFNNKFVSC